MDLGLVGLGKMGGNMRLRLRQAGHRVVGYDRDPNLADVGSLAALVAALPAPRAVWVMVPAGPATDATVDALAALLSSGDVLIDGGNSNFRESIARGKQLHAKGIGFIDAGTSGGIWGLTEGYCIMVGGSPESVAQVQPVFDALVAPGGFAHVGKIGAGHFTKMVHNGVEYGMMQAYGEGYELLQSATGDLGVDVGAALEVWKHGSVVRSWLLDLLVDALNADPGLSQIAGVAADSGEGRWTVEESIRRAVPLHVISAALYARFGSRQDDSPAMKAVAALRNQFGGHAVQKA